MMIIRQYFPQLWYNPYPLYARGLGLCLFLVRWSVICCQDSCFMDRQRRIATRHVCEKYRHIDLGVYTHLRDLSHGPHDQTAKTGQEISVERKRNYFLQVFCVRQEDGGGVNWESSRHSKSEEFWTRSQGNWRPRFQSSSPSG